MIAQAAPIPARATKAAISAFAENVARKLGFSHATSINSFVTRLGGTIEYSVGTPNKNGLPESIVVRSKKDFTIYLPTMTSPQRDRFTIAHELGHLFLHFPLVAKHNPGSIMIATRWVDESNPDLVRTEWEANWFAASFLMPEEAFGADVKRLGIELTAAKFQISSQAATIRAKSLGLN